MDKPTNLSEKLKELRTAHLYTQDYVAGAIGVVRQTYSHYETGKRMPDAETIYKLSCLYNISVDDLMHYSFSDTEDIDFYCVPTQTESSIELSKYISFLNEPSTKRKFQLLNDQEKRLLYLFGQIKDTDDKKELIEIARIKAAKNHKE